MVRSLPMLAALAMIQANTCTEKIRKVMDTSSCKYQKASIRQRVCDNFCDDNADDASEWIISTVPSLAVFGSLSLIPAIYLGVMAPDLFFDFMMVTPEKRSDDLTLVNFTTEIDKSSYLRRGIHWAIEKVYDDDVETHRTIHAFFKKLKQYYSFGALPGSLNDLFTPNNPSEAKYTSKTYDIVMLCVFIGIRVALVAWPIVLSFYVVLTWFL